MRILALFALITLQGCASYKPPVKHEFKRDRSYTASYDRVWTNIIEWFATNNIPIKTIDKASGLISTEHNLSNRISNSCDCGKSGFGVTVSSDIVANFNVFVKKQADSTCTINVSTFFKTTVTQSSFSSSVPNTVSSLDCESTGILESAILDFAGR